MFKNNMLTAFWAVAILLTAVPAGFLLAYMTKDELKQGKKWFGAITCLSIIGSIVFLFLKNETVALTFVYMAIVASISLRKAIKR